MADPAHEQGENGGRPLSDLVVLDLSRVLTGPYAAMMLGDLGAVSYTHLTLPTTPYV